VRRITRRFGWNIRTTGGPRSGGFPTYRTNSWLRAPSGDVATRQTDEFTGRVATCALAGLGSPRLRWSPVRRHGRQSRRPLPRAAGRDVAAGKVVSRCPASLHDGLAAQVDLPRRAATFPPRSLAPPVRWGSLFGHPPAPLFPSASSVVGKPPLPGFTSFPAATEANAWLRCPCWTASTRGGRQSGPTVDEKPRNRGRTTPGLPGLRPSVPAVARGWWRSRRPRRSCR